MLWFNGTLRNLNYAFLKDTPSSSELIPSDFLPFLNLKKKERKKIETEKNLSEMMKCLRITV